jgi:membrane protein
VTGRIRKLVATTRALLHESVALDPDGLTRKKAFLLYVIRLWVQVAKGLVRDKCLQQASSLAYKTVLSIVPLAAVALSLLKAFGGFEGSDSAVVVFLSRHLLAVDPDTLASYVTEFTNRISFGAVGGVGIAVLLAVAVSLFTTVEKTLNDVWKTQVRRGLIAKFTTFYAILTLGPLLLSVSLYQTARVQAALDGALIGRLSAYVAPLVVTWMMLVLCYKLFPTTRVRWGPAMIGGALAAVGFEAVKFAFNVYVAQALLSGYNKIYGAIALFPLFLVWVYVAWIIVLFGAEFAYTLQHLAHLVREDQRRRFRGLGELERRAVLNEFLAVRAMVVIAGHWDRGAGAMGPERIAEVLSVPQEAVEAVLDRLALEGMIRRDLEGADELPVYLPNGPLDRQDVAEILMAFRRGYLGSGQGAGGDELERRLLAAEDAFIGSLKGLSLQELVRAESDGASLLDVNLSPEPVS